MTQIVDLFMQDIRLDGCSALHEVPQSENGTKPLFRTGMYIQNCTDIQRALIANSMGNGLTMFNNDGTVSIENCTYEENEAGTLKGNLGVLDCILK